MESVPISDTETFWSTCAQLAVVIGLTLVLELRFLSRRWTARDRVVRRWIGAVYFVAAISVVVAINIAIVVMLNRTYEPWTLQLERYVLTFAISLTVLSPVVDLFAAAYVDPLLKAADRLPNSQYSRLRTRILASISLAAEETRKTLDLLERLDRAIVVGKRSLTDLDPGDETVDAPDARRAEIEAAVQTAKKSRRKVRRLLRVILRAWEEAEKNLDELEVAAEHDNLAIVEDMLDQVRGKPAGGPPTT